jgi:hypothetical protein
MRPSGRVIEENVAPCHAHARAAPSRSHSKKIPHTNGARARLESLGGTNLGSAGKIRHQLYNEFRAGKLNGVNFQGVPANEAQDPGHGFRRLDAARCAMEPTQAKGQNSDAKDDDGERDLWKRVFLLFLPDVNDRGKETG